MTTLPPPRSTPNLLAVARDYVATLPRRRDWRPVAVAVAIFALGCASAPSPQPVSPGLPSAGTHAARIEQGAETIIAITPSIAQHADEIAQPQVATVRTLATGIKEDAGKVQSDLAIAQGHADALARQMIGMQLQHVVDLASKDVAYAELESKWYVVWGRRIECGFFWLVTAWAVLGVVSVIFNFTGLGFLVGLGKEIRRFLPLANVFGWIVKGIEMRRAANAIATGGAANAG